MAVNISAAEGPCYKYKTSPAIGKFKRSMCDYLGDLNDEFDVICTGAFIFDHQDRILLIQRAASDTWPNFWEVPGGACEVSDSTILDSLVREVWEETRLIVTRIFSAINDGGKMLSSRKKLRILKYEFEVEVERTDVIRLNPAEHQTFKWMTAEECQLAYDGGGNCSSKVQFTSEYQASTVLESFRQRKERKSSTFN
ncbi:unnamed protein product [Blumeria hordei]|uniref:Nudix hydrolase domain-containing protein n=1 Tax=Blumeria hordei TaxID=2867405 RepID=A0A383UKR7_BLUHO|nr:unnamed protein product [Blumeria hordei]